MKNMKHTITIVLVVCTIGVAAAQDTVSGPDGKVKGWYMSYWYDTCWGYYDTTSINGSYLYPYTSYDNNPLSGQVILSQITMLSYDSDKYLVAKGERVKYPAAVKGVGIWLMDMRGLTRWNYDDILDTNRLPEYIHMYQRGDNDTMIFLDSVRWDTAGYQILKVPLNADSARFGFGRCLLYTVYFKKPVEVDSLFFIAGTFNSNIVTWEPYWNHKPIYYLGAWCCHMWNGCPPTYSAPFLMYHRTRNMWWNITETNRTQLWGVFMPLIDFVDLHVVSADSTMGTAGPYDTVSANTTQRIWAQPYRGYRFSHWNDGDTHNPRDIRLVCDTTFVAYFDTAALYHVEVSSNREYGGRVDGGGDYYVNETAVLRAVPLMANYHFIRWNDGDTSNPRYVVVTQDTAFEAQFAREGEGIEQAEEVRFFSLSPNPTRDEVSVTVKGMAGATCRLTLRDEAGRELLHRQMEGGTLTLSTRGLATGVYFVTIDTPQGTGTQKLVVEP